MSYTVIKIKAERKFKGVKAAVGEMRSCNRYDGTYLEVHYDMEEDEVYTHFHASFGMNSWTEYHDPAVIAVGMYSSPIKMVELKEDILRAIALDEESRVEYAAMRAYDEACSKKMLALVEA